MYRGGDLFLDLLWIRWSKPLGRNAIGLAMQGVLFLADRGDELKPGRSIEHSESHGGGCDPPVAVMEFVGERIADLCAPHT